MPAPFVLKGRHPKVQRRVRSHALIQRYFTDLEAASSMYYEIPTATLAGDFRVEVDCLSSPNGFYLVNDDNSSRVLAGSTKEFFYQDAANSTRSTSIDIAEWNKLVDGNLRCVEVQRESTAASLVVSSGNPAVIGSLVGGVFAISKIGGGWVPATSVPTFDGYIANLKIYDGDALIRHYPLDDAPDSTTIRELVSGANGTKVNITPVATELYTFNAQANQWESTTSSKVIPLPAELAGQFPYTLPMALS